MKVGDLYCIHKIELGDTLDGISIRYDISKNLVRQANEFTGDEIYMFKFLIIPFRAKPVYGNSQEKTIE